MTYTPLKSLSKRKVQAHLAAELLRRLRVGIERHPNLFAVCRDGIAISIEAFIFLAVRSNCPDALREVAAAKAIRAAPECLRGCAEHILFRADTFEKLPAGVRDFRLKPILDIGGNIAASGHHVRGLIDAMGVDDIEQHRANAP
jgi:hypothetical protein